MAKNNSAILTFGYSGTTFTRQYRFDGLTTSQCNALKNKVIALNDSIASGTDDGLSDFFISDDFDPSNNVGKCKGIVAAQIESVVVTDII